MLLYIYNRVLPVKVLCCADDTVQKHKDCSKTEIMWNKLPYFGIFNHKMRVAKGK